MSKKMLITIVLGLLLTAFVAGAYYFRGNSVQPMYDEQILEATPTETLQNILPTQGADDGSCQTDADCSGGMTCGGRGKCAYWEQPAPTGPLVTQPKSNPVCGDGVCEEIERKCRSTSPMTMDCGPYYCEGDCR